MPTLQAIKATINSVIRLATRADKVRGPELADTLDGVVDYVQTQTDGVLQGVQQDNDQTVQQIQADNDQTLQQVQQLAGGLESTTQALIQDYPNRFSSLATVLHIDGTSGSDGNTGASNSRIKTLARAAQILNGKFVYAELHLYGTLEVSGTDLLFQVPYLTLWVQGGATLRFRKRSGITDANSVVVGEGHWRLIQYGHSLNVRVNGTLDVEAHAGSTGAGDPFYYRTCQGAIALANPSAFGPAGNNPTVYHDEQQQITIASWGTVSIGANATLFTAGTNGHAGYGSRQVRYCRSVFSGSFTLGAGGYEQYGLDDRIPNVDFVTVYVDGVNGNDGWPGYELARPVKTVKRVAEIVRGRYARVRMQLTGNTEVNEDCDFSQVDDLEILLNGYQLYHRRKTVNGKEGTCAIHSVRNVLLNGTGTGSEVRVEALGTAPSDADYTSSTDFCYNQGAYRLGSSMYGGYTTGRLVNAARVHLGNYTTLVAMNGGGIFPSIANGIEYLENTASVAQHITLGLKAALARRARHLVIHKSILFPNDVFQTIVSGSDHILQSGTYELSFYAKTVGYGGLMYGSIWSCRFAWFAGTVNSSHEDWKAMQQLGHNHNGKQFQVRTYSSGGNSYNQTLDVKLMGEGLSSPMPVRFELRRLSYDPSQNA